MAKTTIRRTIGVAGLAALATAFIPLDSHGLDAWIGDLHFGTLNWPGNSDCQVDKYNGDSPAKDVVIPSTIIMPEDVYENGVHHTKYHAMVVRRIYGPLFKGNSTVETIVLPDTVTDWRGYTFDGPFQNCASLRSVTLSKNFGDIPFDAFKGSAKLERVNLSNVTNVAGRAFSGCTSLKDVGSLERLCKVGEDAFNGCSSLPGKLYLPRITEIAGNGFANCSSLTEVETGNDLTSVSGCAFKSCSGLKTALIRGTFAVPVEMFAYDSALKTVDLGGLVRFAGDYDGGRYPFRGCTSLAEVWLGEGVEEIGDTCLDGASALRRLSFTANMKKIKDNGLTDNRELREISSLHNVTNIGERAFDGLASLSIALDLPRIQRIGANAFRGCASIPWVKIGRSLEQCGGGAFANCSGLSFADVDGCGNCTIPNNMFSGCTSLAECTVGNGISGIEPLYYRPWSSPFLNCTNLRRVEFGWNIETIPAGLFQKPDAAAGCASLEECIFPCVTNIGAYAFKECASLSSLPDLHKVKSIGEGAFRGCTSLKGNLRTWDVEWIGDSAFADCTGIASLTILGSKPDSGKSVYVGTDAGLITYVTPAWGDDATTWQGRAVRVIGDSDDIPASWLARYPAIFEAADGNVDAMIGSIAANGKRTVAECYALGIDPEDPNDDLRITSFKMKDDKPVITVNHTEDGSGNSILPRMRTLGKASLSDEWQEVPEVGDPTHRFFTVTVAEP